MITPKFSCTQTEDSVITQIYCPAVRASDVEISVDATLLTVHINPYFLRLNFPHSVVEDDHSSAQYDPSSGYLTITLTKEVKGQHFPDLDLLAKLLAPCRTRDPPGPSIEVIPSRDTLQDDDVTDLSARTDELSLDDEFLRAAANDWQLPQSISSTLPEFHTSSKRFYGFLDMYTGYFTHVSHMENEINELGDDAETCNVDERRARRIVHENEKWDEEHYMADYADDECIRELVAWQNPDLTTAAEVIYTEAENMTMLRLPRKEYMMDQLQERNLYLTLIALLFAHAYDKRTTLGEPTAESAWTICSLIAAFSALDPPPYSPVGFAGETDFGPTNTEIMSTLVTSYRRCLTFPLYRSYQLAERCKKDVAITLFKGKRLITRYLLGMKDILDHHDVYYVYSKIWVDDFCVWIQAGASDGILKQIGKRLDALIVPKAAIGWELEQLEEATRLAANRGSDSDDETFE